MSVIEKTVFDKIEEVAGDEEAIQKLLLTDTEWEVLYHLSPIRENLLQWMDFHGDEKVLELNAECGALTGLLCRTCGTVDAISSDSQMAHINRLRHAKQENLTVYEEMPEDLSSDYDYVVLIGPDLEEEALSETLIFCRNRLNEIGKMILALDNKFGLDFWAGETKEDGEKTFDSLKIGLEKSRYSKNKITEMVRNAGYSRIEFYYPMPDFRLPNEIYYEAYLPGSSSIRHMNENYRKDQYLMFQKEAVWDALCEDGMFEEFANSFLLVCE